MMMSRGGREDLAYIDAEVCYSIGKVGSLYSVQFKDLNPLLNSSIFQFDQVYQFDVNTILR